MRSFVFLICMTVILAALPTSQAMAAKQTAVVTAKQVNVRQGPGTLYHVVMKVDQGETYRVVREKAGWVQLEIKQNQTGWVAQQYIAYVRKQAMATEEDRKSTRLNSSHV